MTTSSSERLRVALIGAGAMGALHARVVAQSQDATLSCVVDPDRATGQFVAERFESEWKSEADSLSDYDAAIVATPTPTHAAWATRALEADLPVLVEKPVTEDPVVVRHLVEIARSRGVPLMCGLLERFNPAVCTAMEIVEEPLHVTTVRHSPYVPRIGTGVAFDLLIHDVDIVLRLAGDSPTTTKAQLASSHPKSDRSAEDAVEAVLTFPAGMLAALSASRLSQRKVRTLSIAELDRLVEVDMVRNDVTVFRHIGSAALDDGPGYRQQTIIDIPTIQDAREPLVRQLERFIALARGEVDPVAELDGLLAPHVVVDEIIRLARDSR